MEHFRWQLTTSENSHIVRVTVACCDHGCTEFHLREEIRIINEWVDHMGSVRDRLDPQNGMPRVFHWSAAEPTVLDKAYNSAKARHPEHAGWPELGWYDFMTKVMRGGASGSSGRAGVWLEGGRPTPSIHSASSKRTGLIVLLTDWGRW